MTAITPALDCRQMLVERIYRHISAQPVGGNVSLLGGQMGYALFESYYQRHFGLPEDNQPWERIVACLTAVQENRLPHSFAGGIAGVAWGFLHLCKNELLTTDELDPQDITEGLDEALFEASMILLEEGDYDYLHGGLSACLYFLERTPSSVIADYAEQMVERLSAVAVRFPNGDISWKFRDFNQFSLTEADRYNLGLSHGTAGIVAVLSLLYEKGYAQLRCAELISGTLQWMWRVRNKTGQSVFPNTVAATPVEQQSRLGWCYGDLGIANTFWLAGTKLANQTWKDKARQTILHAAGRRGADVLINDAALCHGSTGAVHIFRKFARRLGDPRLDEAADFWLRQTVDYRRPETGEDVFWSYQGQRFESNLSLLDGETSVGIALLSELGTATAWDRLLLLS